MLIVRQTVLSEEKESEEVSLIQLMKHGLEKNKTYRIDIDKNLINRES